MVRQILRRTLSAVLAIAMVLTAMSAAGVMFASAKIGVSTGATPSDVTFIVPEAIYLKPAWNSYYQAQQMAFQIYVNNVLKSDGTVTPSTEESSQGYMYFNYANTSSVKITFECLDQSGGVVYDGNVTYGDAISRTAGMAYTATPSNNAIIISAGKSPTMIAAQTGAYVRWTATFTDTQDKREKTAVAYTYLYKPYVQPVGVGIRTENDRGTNTFGSILAWISGVHDTDESDGERYPNTTVSSSGYGLQPISNSISSSGVKVGNLYAQLASTNDSDSHFRWNNYSNKNPDNWLNTTSSPLYVPDKSFRHIDNHDSSGTGDKAFYSLEYSPKGLLTIDTSRYTNLNQIPNLSIGLMVTDDESSCSGGAWFVSSYTGSPTSNYVKDYNTNNTSNAERYWNTYGQASSTVSIIASAGSYSNPTGSEADELKFNGRWPRAISTSSQSGLFLAGAGYFNREDKSGSHYGGDTIWDIAELRANITFYNKTDLRAAVLNAIKKSSTLCPIFYNTSSMAWQNYQNLYRSAAMALTKLDGTFYAQATVNGSSTSYSTPTSLATALNNAVNELTKSNTTARVSGLHATQTIVGLMLMDNGTYKCIGINGANSKKTSDYTSFNKVIFSADTIDGYSFLGLESKAYDQTFQVGSAVTLPQSFTTSADGATISGSTVTYVHAGKDGTDGSGNIYYVYYYVANPYTVHFDSNGGTGSMDNQAFTYSVEQKLSPNKFTRRAYDFAGWATSSSGSIAYQNEQTVSNLTKNKNGSVTLYAIWSPSSYTITYKTAGGSITSSTYTTTYTIESAIGLPEAVKPGYDMAGWRADGTGSWGEMTYPAGSSINTGKYGDVTLTAQWSPITYYVSFNGNGATEGSMNPQTFTYAIDQALSANVYKRNGCTFSGWALSEDATTAVFKDKAVVGDLTTVGGSTVTLFAVWTPINYTITYSAEGGTIRDSYNTYTDRYTVLESVKLPVQVERTGYNFAGWKPATTVGNWGNQAYNGQQSPGLYGNVTLNAQWSVQSYTILYNTLEGTITSSTYTTSYDITTKITLPNATKTGYQLAGWQSDNAGNWGNILYVAGNVGAGRYGDVNMTAKWTNNTYFIAFNGNGSTGGLMFNQTVQYDEEAQLTANAYVRNGFTFLGWSKSDAATAPTYTDGATVVNLTSQQGDTIQLFAVWSRISYNISYDAAGGTIVTPGTQTYSVNERIAMATASRTGYSFNGWTPTESVGSWQTLTLYSGTLEAGNYGNVSLVAQWSKTVYAIRYDAVGGTMSGKYTTEYSIDTEIVLPTVVRSGYAFNGWQADDAWNNIVVIDYVPTGLLGDVVLQAIWVQRTYTIHYNPCGAEGSMDDQTVQFDREQALRINTFTYLGYSFSGWAVQQGGPVAYSNGATVYNLSEEDNGTVELYAVWAKRSFTISYNLNGASGSLLTSTAKMDDAAITLRNYAPGDVMINGIPYEFIGWAYTKADADNGIVSYANKASFGVNAGVLNKAEVTNWDATKPTITLYAVWANIKVSLEAAAESTTVIDRDKHVIYGLKEHITEGELRNLYLQINGLGDIVLEYTGYIGTGTVVRLKNANGQEVESFEIVIFGDSDGDGIVTMEDVRDIKAHVSGANPLTSGSAQASACDMDGDGEITMQDAILMKSIISGAQTYDQVNQRIV